MEVRVGVLRLVSAKVLEPVGGAWQHGEILYFAAPGEEAQYGHGWQEFFESLTGKKR